MKERVGRLRKNIVIEPDEEDENLFELSFESRDPLIAQEVAGILASAFMGETLKLREERAVGTTAFMKAETERLRKEVEIQEATVNRYQAKHRYELPEQLQANLSTLEQLRRELQSDLLRLSGLQDRRVIVIGKSRMSPFPLVMVLSMIQGHSAMCRSQMDLLT